MSTSPKQVFPSALPAGYDESYEKKHAGRIEAEKAIQETAILISDFNHIMSEISQQPRTSETQKSPAMQELENQLIDNLTKLSEVKTILDTRLSQIRWRSNPFTSEQGRRDQKLIIEGLLLQIKDAIKRNIKSVDKKSDGNIEIQTIDGFTLFLGAGEVIFRLLFVLLGAAGGKTRKHRKHRKHYKKTYKKSYKKSHKKSK
jgi:hypothetical protein